MKHNWVKWTDNATMSEKCSICGLVTFINNGRRLNYALLNNLPMEDYTKEIKCTEFIIKSIIE